MSSIIENISKELERLTAQNVESVCADCETSFMTDESEYFEVCQKCGDKAAAEEEDKKKEDRRRAGIRRWEGLTPKLYRTTDVDHPTFNRDLYNLVQSWESVDGLGLGIQGGPGTSKTRIMFLLLKRMAIEGHSFATVSGSDFASLAQNQFNQGSTFAKKVLEWKRAGFLLLDDLDKAPRWTDRTESELFEVLEARVKQMRPTLWTANCSLEEIVGRMTSHRGPAIMRRLEQFTKIYDLG